MKPKAVTGLHPNQTSKTRLSLATIIGLTVLSSVVIITLITAWLVQPPLTSAKQKVFQVIPFPLVLIDGHPLSVKAFLDERKIAQKLGSSLTYNLTETDLNSVVFSKLIEDAEVQGLSAKVGITLTDDELANAYQARVQQSSSASPTDFANLLARYQLTPTEFLKLILEPELLSNKLLIWYNGQSALHPAEYQFAHNLKNEILAGTDFKSLVQIYSQDQPSKTTQGDLGFLAVSDLLPELQTGVAQALPGEVVILPSRLGLHIIQLKAKDYQGQQDTERVHIQQIFLPLGGFQNWFNRQTKTFKIWQIVKL